MKIDTRLSAPRGRQAFRSEIGHPGIGAAMSTAGVVADARIPVTLTAWNLSITPAGSASGTLNALLSGSGLKDAPFSLAFIDTGNDEMPGVATLDGVPLSDGMLQPVSEALAAGAKTLGNPEDAWRVAGLARRLLTGPFASN